MAGRQPRSPWTSMSRWRSRGNCLVANALPDGDAMVRGHDPSGDAFHDTISHAGLVGGGVWP